VKYVETVVFRPHHRHAPFTDPLNWTDYRWDAGPWHRGAAATRGWGHRQRSRRHPFVLLLIAGLAALFGAKLLSSLQSRNISWARRGVYAVILLMIVSAFSRNRRNGWW